MRRLIAVLCGLTALGACDKHDPILPGIRTAIFTSSKVNVQNKNISNIPKQQVVIDNTNCQYRQDSDNVIWDGERKVFSGFPTSNTVDADTRPVCSGQYLYAGLTTGEVIKINPKTRQILWIADVYRATNLTGGASMVDIVAPIVPHKNAVYAGGLGDAFCKLDAKSGDKKWCLDIGVAVPFVIAENYAFVVGTDNGLYAIDTQSGDAVWRADVKSQVAPVFNKNTISVGKDVFNTENGKKILDK